MIKQALVFLFPFLLFNTLLTAQIDYSPEFQDLLDQTRLEFFEPVEANYKDIRVAKNPYQEYDFAIRSRKDKLEIRYIINPYSNNPISSVPHISSVRTLTNLATNQEESLIAGHAIPDSTLQQDFNADWGKVFIFEPKVGFSRWRTCKMLSLFKEGCGLIHVLFLFDEPSQEVDNRFLAVRFREEMEN